MSAAAVAVPGLLDTLRNPGQAFVKMLSEAVATFVGGARRDIEQVLGQRLFSTLDTSGPSPRPFTENPGLRRLNLGMALAADILVAAVLLFGSVRAMWEHQSYRARYSLRVLLPRVLLAVVLMHFSLLFIQMAIDLDNALCAVAISLGDQLRVEGMPWSPAISADAVQRMSVEQDLFHAVFAVVVVVALLILVLAYVLRHALLSVLVVLAPLAGLCTALPDTRNYARTWLRLFLVTVFMQAVQLVVLRVAMTVAVEGGGGIVQTFEALATLFLMLKVPGALNEAAHLETKAETLGKHAEKALRKAVFHHHSGTTRRAPTHRSTAS